MSETRDDISAPTRRGIVHGVGASVVGGATLVAGAAAAQTAPPAPPTGLRNPAEAYPKPPFQAQQQPWPGLARDMNPKPDHGETSYRGSGRLAGRKALVTGGDSGIGGAAVIAYAREGADVAINYLPAEEPDAQETLELVRREGRRGIALPGDIREESVCTRLVADAVRELGGLDILVNNAARQQAKPSLDAISTEDFDATLKTNLYALFWITKAALPHLRPGSAIINTASVVAYDPPQAILDYAMTKAGIVNFTKGLAKQLAPRGIRVNAVAPGPYWTPLQPSGGQLPDRLPQFGADAPLGRPGQPAEIASLYVLLALAEASYTTGSVLGSTGGETGP